MPPLEIAFLQAQGAKQRHKATRISVMGGRIFGHGGENFLLLLPKIRPPVTENPPSLCRKATRPQPHNATPTPEHSKQCAL